MLYRLAFAKTGNSHDSEDTVQEVFLKYIRHSGKFDNEEHRKAWLIRVTINSSANITRRRGAELGDYGGADFGESDKNLARVETQATVYPAVMSLPEKYRVIIHLFYYEEMQLPEICRTTGLPLNTVKSRLLRARNMLREKLKEVEFDGEF
jgi:RNA polymerase sigma-70 factor (ECF subfamily)